MRFLSHDSLHASRLSCHEWNSRVNNMFYCNVLVVRSCLLLHLFHLILIFYSYNYSISLITSITINYDNKKRWWYIDTICLLTGLCVSTFLIIPQEQEHKEENFHDAEMIWCLLLVNYHFCREMIIKLTWKPLSKIAKGGRGATVSVATCEKHPKNIGFLRQMVFRESLHTNEAKS